MAKTIQVSIITEDVCVPNIGIIYEMCTFIILYVMQDLAYFTIPIIPSATVAHNISQQASDVERFI